MIRPDYPLIKHLTLTHGAATASEWQRPPYVILPEQGFLSFMDTESVNAKNFPTPFEHVPWDDAVYDFQSIRTAVGARVGLEDRGRCWIRIRTLEKYLENTAVSSPWMLGPHDLLEPFRKGVGEWLVLEAWESNTAQGFPGYPDVSLVPRNREWSPENHAHLYTNTYCRDNRVYGSGFCNISKCLHPQYRMRCFPSDVVMEIGVTLSIITLAFLTRAPEYPVEVQSVPKKRKKPDPRVKEKPWVREDLPRIIFIDPSRVKEYKGQQEGSNSHASPRPHQRRGHWRNLRADRYRRKGLVWVRQSWIGETTWEAKGQIYRVVFTEAGNNP